MSENKEQYYKSVYFDLPFLLFVRDGFRDKDLEEWAKAYSEGSKDLPYSPYAPKTNEPGFFAIGGGFPVYIPPDNLAEAYVVNLGNGILVGVQFLRRINQSSTVKLCGEIIGDRTGRATFSSVSVNFDLQIFNPDIFHRMDIFVDLSIRAINKFIEHYRVLADRFYIRAITPQVIQSFYIVTSFKDGTSITQTYGTGSGPLHGLGGAIPDEQDDVLREALKKEEEPSIIATIELEVRDKIDLREWRLAVIEAAVLFETWLSIHVRSLFKSKGLSDNDIEAKFHKNDKYRTPLSAYAIAKDLIGEASGYDFGNTAEFSNWCDKTKDVRNDIVHGKKFIVTRQEAIDSYDAVKKAIDVIADNT
ncbi:MAG: hypothetical protein WKF74_15675 [Pyrinomonadaceae bacterium]